jgi:dipeptidyl aminopeptidase/acylaminoacyl peptidase
MLIFKKLKFYFGTFIIALSLLHADDHVIKPMDIFEMEGVSDPRISPDGSKILYVRSGSDVMSDKRYSNIWIINFGGTNNRPLTSGQSSNSQPRWSPDGKQIIYVSSSSGSGQIHKRWMDTGETTILTNVQTGPHGISWSPDGKHVAFYGTVPQGADFKADLPTPPEGAEWATPAKVIDRLVYRFDGVGYLKGYKHLFVVPSEGGTAQQLTSGRYNFASYRGGQTVWSQDSKYIYASTNLKDDWEKGYRQSDIYQINATDGTMDRLTDRDGPDGNPMPSPDGKYIAYIGYDDKRMATQISHMYVMNLKTKKIREIKTKLDRGVSNLSWSGDGKNIFFFYDDKGNTKLAKTTLRGKTNILANNGGGRYTMSYGGGGSYTMALNGNYVHTYSRPDVPSDLAVGNIKGGKSKVITSVNEDILTGKELGKVEEIWYKSSYDGLDIQGWIIKPPGFDPSKKYPLILEIHGGPFANYGDRFDLEKQLMAAQGYVVLYTNPRGSTSYGEKFAQLIHHDYPGNDFYDLNSGVDAVIKKGYIDEDNLFVTGGSGGGVLTCWMIGRTTRFKAAVTVYPVINWSSFVLYSDIPGVANYWFPGMPWDNAEIYESKNLLSVVKNVTSPTMVLTGEADYRTPMPDSEQYYAALQLLDVQSVLVRVPDEPHGISVRPSHHLSKIQHIMGWMNKYNSGNRYKGN